MWSIEGRAAGGMKAGGQQEEKLRGEWKRAQGVRPAPGNRESL